MTGIVKEGGDQDSWIYESMTWQEADGQPAPLSTNQADKAHRGRPLELQLVVRATQAGSNRALGPRLPHLSTKAGEPTAPLSLWQSTPGLLWV